MANRTIEHTGHRTQFTGDGTLLEGDRVLGRVRFDVTATKPAPDRLGEVAGTIQALGTDLDLFDLQSRDAKLTLDCSRFSWQCFISELDVAANFARLANRSGQGIELH